MDITTLKFFTFSQNNSGGTFIVDQDVDQYVIVQATCADDANSRAKEHGIYFNGCVSGMDCDCCGDRWSEQWDDDYGNDMPEIYGDSPELSGSPTIIYYTDGKVRYVNRSFDGK